MMSLDVFLPIFNNTCGLHLWNVVFIFIIILFTIICIQYRHLDYSIPIAVLYFFTRNPIQFRFLYTVPQERAIKGLKKKPRLDDADSAPIEEEGNGLNSEEKVEDSVEKEDNHDNCTKDIADKVLEPDNEEQTKSFKADDLPILQKKLEVPTSNKKNSRRHKKKKNQNRSKYKTTMDDSSDTSSVSDLYVKHYIPPEETKIYGPLKLFQDLDLDNNALYQECTLLVLSELQLDEYNFPKASLYRPGKSQYKNPNPNPTKRTCSRCKKDFHITDGKYEYDPEQCTYHPLKLDSIYLTYNCCGNDTSVRGCKRCPYHVTAEYFLEDADFVRTKFKKHKKLHECNVYGLDCEMVYTTAGLELAKVCLVGMDGLAIYETFVRPQNPVVDYNTMYSGVTEKDLKNLKITLSDVQAFLLKLLDKDSILVGHGLENDLRVLRLIHRKVVDTSVVYLNGSRYKKSLKKLAKEVLYKDIQMSENGHNNVEDARTCVELTLHKIQEEMKSRPLIIQDENVDKENSSHLDTKIHLKISLKSLRNLVLDSDALYQEYELHVLNEKQMWRYNFPESCLYRPGKSAYKNPIPIPTQRNCCRCRRKFNLKDGKYESTSPCKYHPQELDEDGIYFLCCNEVKDSEGCMSSQYHISTLTFLGHLDFVRAKLNKNKKHRKCNVYGLDYKTVYTTAGLELGKICVMEVDGQVIYETFVRPQNQILDYNTVYSGVTEQVLENLAKTLSDVQAFLLKLLDEESILVGHGLVHCLRSLRLIHPKVVDISILYDDASYLQTVANEVLGKDFQMSNNELRYRTRTYLQLTFLKTHQRLKLRPAITKDDNGNKKNSGPKHQMLELEPTITKHKNDNKKNSGPKYYVFNSGPAITKDDNANKNNSGPKHQMLELGPAITKHKNANKKYSSPKYQVFNNLGPAITKDDNANKRNSGPVHHMMEMRSDIYDMEDNKRKWYYDRLCNAAQWENNLNPPVIVDHTNHGPIILENTNQKYSGPIYHLGPAITKDDNANKRNSGPVHHTMEMRSDIYAMEDDKPKWYYDRLCNAAQWENNLNPPVIVDHTNHGPIILENTNKKYSGPIYHLGPAITKDDNANKRNSGPVHHTMEMRSDIYAMEDDKPKWYYDRLCNAAQWENNLNPPVIVDHTNHGPIILENTNEKYSGPIYHLGPAITKDDNANKRNSGPVDHMMEMRSDIYAMEDDKPKWYYDRLCNAAQWENNLNPPVTVDHTNHGPIILENTNEMYSGPIYHLGPAITKDDNANKNNSGPVHHMMEMRSDIYDEEGDRTQCVYNPLCEFNLPRPAYSTCNHNYIIQNGEHFYTDCLFPNNMKCTVK